MRYISILWIWAIFVWGHPLPFNICNRSSGGVEGCWPFSLYQIDTSGWPHNMVHVLYGDRLLVQISLATGEEALNFCTTLRYSPPVGVCISLYSSHYQAMIHGQPIIKRVSIWVSQSKKLNFDFILRTYDLCKSTLWNWSVMLTSSNELLDTAVSWRCYSTANIWSYSRVLIQGASTDQQSITRTLSVVFLKTSNQRPI